MTNKTKITLGALLLGALLPLSNISAASLNSGAELNPGACEGRMGPALINVIQKVVNDVDSGTAGNYWAYDNYMRHIQVWRVGDDEYCALVEYLGKFDAQADQRSPGNTGTLTGKEDGIMIGGYRGHINGQLLTNPNWKRFGSVGSFDYACDLQANCPGRVSWIDQYFQAGSTFAYGWWGWIYRGGVYGTWVNSSDGNAGDVVGIPD